MLCKKRFFHKGAKERLLSVLVKNPCQFFIIQIAVSSLGCYFICRYRYLILTLNWKIDATKTRPLASILGEANGLKDQIKNAMPYIYGIKKYFILYIVIFIWHHEKMK